MPASVRAVRPWLACIAFLLAAFTTASAQHSVPAVRVSKDAAEVRSRPALKSEVLETVPKGAALEAIDREGDWYWVFLPPNENGTKVAGWVYAPDVEIVTEGDRRSVLLQFTETIAAAKARDASDAATTAKPHNARGAARAAKAAAREEARLERARQRLEQAQREYDATTQKTAKHDGGTK